MAEFRKVTKYLPFHTKNSPITFISSKLHSQKPLLARQIIVTTYPYINNKKIPFSFSIPFLSTEEKSWTLINHFYNICTFLLINYIQYLIYS